MIDILIKTKTTRGEDPDLILEACIEKKDLVLKEGKCLDHQVMTEKNFKEIFTLKMKMLEIKLIEVDLKLRKKIYLVIQKLEKFIMEK